VRLVEQRERLISAAALTFTREEPPTIGALVSLARVSRNTFYEYFDDLEHVRAAAVQRARQRLDQALRGAERSARTPVERWRVLSRAWFEWAALEPAEARLVLETKGSVLSPAGAVLEAALKRSLEELSVFGVRPNDASAARVVAAAAAGEAFGRELVSECLADAGAVGSARTRLEQGFVDVTVRLLR
jgi:AcrR family transcriptional regulator